MAPFGRLIVEIQSINRKHFEAQVHLPKELSRFEIDVRKWVSESVFRGQISVRLQWTPSREMLEASLPDLAVLKGVQEGFLHLAKGLGLESKQIDLPLILEHAPEKERTGLVQEEAVEALQACVGKALEALSQMRAKEGKALVSDIQRRLEEIQKKSCQVEELSKLAPERMREKWLEKMESLFPKGADLDERIAREVALLAERIDITEELIRLKSHFAQFEECLKASGPVGKKMEFVVQEIGREINTLGAKSSEAKISYLVVEMKTELEKIREQVQNIE
jgi:uncharacterized protein (TIGR00255 family)